MIPLHGIGSRRDLPLPFEFVVAGAGVALIVTFVLLVFAWRHPRWSTPKGVALPRLTRFVDHPLTRWTGRLVALAVFGWTAFALFFGEDRLTNPVFGVVFVWVWVGVVPLSVLAGPIWRALNPLRTLALVGTLIPGRRPTVPWARIGVWPAALALIAFAWLELVQPANATLPVMRGWVLVWLFVGVAGGALLGDSWIAAVDPFEAYATTCSRLSVWQRYDGTIHLVNPLRNAATWRPPAGTLAVVAALLGSTAFDSFGASTWWIRHTQTSAVPSWIWGTLGLLVGVLFVAATFWIGARALGRNAPHRLSPSLVPLVVGYAMGHYFSMLVIEGQRTAIQWSDPLSRGWNVFGTAEWGINTWLFEQPAFTAVVQLCSIVGGHVVGVVLAHDLSVRQGARLAAQLPLLVVMLGYTVGGLILLFNA